MRKTAIACAAALLASGCFQFQRDNLRDLLGESPYKAKTGRRQTGYTDFPVEGQPGVYYVLFEGNAYTPRATVVRYWHRRAAEICPAGYDVERERVDERPEVSGGGGTSAGSCVGGNCTSSGTRSSVSTSYSPLMEGYIRCKPAGGE